MKGDGSENMLKTLVIGVARDPVVGRGAVELGKEQRFPCTIKKRAREHQANSPKLSAVSRPTLISVIAGRSESDLHPLKVWRLACDYIDHGKEGAGAVE